MTKNEHSDSEADDYDELELSKQEKNTSKYSPAVTWKEHFLSHYVDEIKNLAPLPLLNTDTFESKE